MSRAFVREPDGDDTHDDLPDLPDEGGPNWITPAGLARLEARLVELEKERATVGDTLDERPQAQALDRDIRLVRRRIANARVVDLAEQPRNRVAFGAEVEAVDADDRHHVFRIVGEDEVDIAAGRVSWRSPLAKALQGAETGDTVLWPRPAGDLELEITGIRYPGD